ncbi:DegT/DnrJ/EryC1/StrS aminotransferase family protein [Candidatus Beckwithbacteria bacterium]|nr:DegT/DnrJ/EryC1/StrS aminotransferase family protein [Candidatus Beckwithbacteria bacterium]
MSPIFNSIGSNYDFNFSLKALGQIFAPDSDKNLEILKFFLEKEFEGQAFLFYKGRNAIEFALKNLNLPKNSLVATQAFTCYSIEEAIKKTGLKLIYFDLKAKSLNPDFKNIKKIYKKNPQIKAIILQNSLGFANEIEKIYQWSRQNKIILILDLAQSYGIKTANLKNLADIFILSFGRDKILDAITGGACILKKFDNKLDLIQNQVAFRQRLKDLTYPFVCFLIRKTYPIYLGKILHFLVKKTGFETNPIYNPVKKIAPLPSQYVNLIFRQLKNLDQSLKHRQKISKLYYQNLKNISLINQTDIENGVNLRFPIWVEDIEKVLSSLKAAQIYLADRWYRKAIDCGKINCQTDYRQGTCPNAEKLSQHILNLPTHQEIDETKAIKIINVISKLENNK